ncbi:MAG: NADH dehydrogenase subunit K [Candidatus Methanohalarchaeum thermophilum]|uniref:NADH dehydrogenase subunit K n=1 Tax=Methanohalarchaeum thermophilum TaxID=1903181 RepID=A0A1Q6DX76_METT1|nr:MAG: NADH dehydrogenase subunit K [Candidatus Methanohalarchaeum thermophilum]
MIAFHFLITSIGLVLIGLYGVITLRHPIKILMSIELILNAANINLVAFSTENLIGQGFASLVIAISAAEVCVGLAIVYNLYRLKKDIDVMEVNALKW